MEGNHDERSQQEACTIHTAAIAHGAGGGVAHSIRADSAEHRAGAGRDRTPGRTGQRCARHGKQRPLHCGAAAGRAAHRQRGDLFDPGLQFAPGFRRRHARWHRRAGWALVPAGLVAALSGLWMTLFYPWPAGDGVALYWQRLGFGSAMLAALLLGVDALRRRKFAEHGAWMIRAYAIGLGAGTQVFTHLVWLMLVGQPTEASRAVLMGAGWVINLAVAEWIIRAGLHLKRRAGRRVAVPAQTA
ncbi:MAG: DUF2306 domain-containing protein [Caldilinea sp.]|nr:DUF2306 domain-containing protein [Caldilinea sp.]